LRAFDALVQVGTVRAIGASNYSPERLTAALELQKQKGLAEFTALQPLYNLVEREFERTLLPVPTPGTSPCCRTTGWPGAS
jgi:aryl-alcohol dehydrogenase-like predicted oxidoreductase